MQDSKPLTRRSGGRMSLAVLAGSLSALVPLMFGAVTAQVATGVSAQSATAAVFGPFSGFVLVFGWPIAVLATALVGIPGYARLVASGRGERESAMLMLGVGAALGAVVMPLFWAALWGSSMNVLGATVLGLLMGAFGALAFWLTLR